MTAQRGAVASTAVAALAPAPAAELPQESGFVRVVRAVVGVWTIIAGVGAAFVMLADLGAGSALPSELGSLLPEPMVARLLFAALSVGAIAGGAMLLRRMPAGIPLCSGTWAVVAALAACPSVRFNYAEGATPTIELPAAGSAQPAIVAFLLATLFVLLTRALCRGHHPGHAPGTRRVNTVGEVVVGAFFLVSGAAIAMCFAAEVARMGAPAYDRILLPLLVATLTLEGIGLGLIGGSVIARAAAIALLLAVAGGAVDSDLVLDRVAVAKPLFWAPACVVGALALMMPARRA